MRKHKHKLILQKPEILTHRCRDSCSSSMIRYFVLLVSSLVGASAATLPSTLDLIRNSELSNARPNGSPDLYNNSMVQGDIWSWYCTQIPRWSVPKLEPSDCKGMLDYFYLETMHDGGRKMKNFRAPGSIKSSYLETQWTPRKYTFGRVHPLAILLPLKEFPWTPGISKQSSSR